MTSSSAPPAEPPPPSPVDTFPVPAWLTLISFIVLVGVFQWGSVLHSKLLGQRQHCKEVDEESTPPSACARRPPLARHNSGEWSLARLPLAAVNVFRVVAFRWTIELGSYELTVAELVLTFGYIAFLLAWTFTGNQGAVGSELYLLGWSDRAGLLAASQFPLVAALGTKNNVVSLVTGVSYEKLNYIHRVTARSCFGLLLIHAGAKIFIIRKALLPGLSVSLFGAAWIRLAVTALVAFAILFVVSLRFIRSRIYEVFFYTHFIMVLIFLIGAYYHTKETDYSYWIWPSFMFWALDRVLRLTRVVVFNCLGRRARTQDATTELLSDDLVRVTVRRPPRFQWSPGQAAYLTMPSVSRFPLEAHPFSISSIDSELFQSGVSEGDIRAGHEAEQWKEIVFLINVQGGFTKRLGQFAARNESVKVFIDGPYGSSPDVVTYDTSIFVAGGTGITCTLPLFLSVIQAARKRSGRCRRVVFIWAIRDAAQVQWISEALSRASMLTPAWLDVSVRIFVTRGGVGAEGVAVPFSVAGAGLGLSEPALAPDQSPYKDGSTFESFSPPSVRMENGRPDIKAILRGEVSTATGRLSVTVCGPQSLSRSVRHALRFPVSGWASVMSGRPSVTLHVEAFGYA